MSSISGLTSNMSGYLSRLYAQGSQEDSKVNGTDKQSDQSTQGIATLVACLQQNAANTTQSVDSSSGSLSSLGSLDSSTLRGAMRGQETTATDLSDQITAMDTDSDGTVTKEEFLAAKPDDVTDEMATNLWDSFDSESAGSLSTSDLQTAMESGRMQGPPPPPSDMASTEDTDETSETTTDSFISAMDTDGDGIVTKEEFLAAKPDDVSTEMATNLWDSLDTEGTGSLSTDELETAMAAGRSDGPPPPPSDVASSDDTDETTDDPFISAMDTNADGIVTQEEFLAAKPEDVSTEMATNLWNKLDTEGTGSLSTSAFQTAMAANASSQNNAEQVAEAFSLSSMNGFDGVDTQMMMEAIEAYDFSSTYESMGQNSRSSVYAMM